MSTPSSEPDVPATEAPANAGSSLPGPPLVTLPDGLQAHVVLDEVVQASVIPAPVREPEDRDGPRPGTAESMALSYSPAQQADAFRTFLEKNMSLEVLSLQMEIPLPVIVLWSQQEKWLDRKRSIQKELIAQEELQYRQLVLEKRQEVLKRHLDVSDTIESKVKKAVDNIDVDNDPKAISKLRMAAESMSSSANVSARAAAITDRPFSGSGQGKTPIIIVGGGPLRQTPDVKIVEAESRRVE